MQIRNVLIAFTFLAVHLNALADRRPEGEVYHDGKAYDYYTKTDPTVPLELFYEDLSTLEQLEEMLREKRLAVEKSKANLKGDAQFAVGAIIVWGLNSFYSLKIKRLVNVVLGTVTGAKAVGLGADVATLRMNAGDIAKLEKAIKALRTELEDDALDSQKEQK